MIDSLAFGGAGVARLDGYVVFVAGRDARRSRARRGRASPSARYAEARAVEMLEPSPERIAPGCRPSGRAVAGAALRAPARGQARAGRRMRCGGSDASTASRSSRSCPRSSSGATATSSSTRSAPTRTGRLVCGFHAPGRWDQIVEMTDCLLASEARQRGPRGGRGVVPRRRASSAYDRRTGAGLLRNLVVREGRRTGQLQVRLVTSAGELDTRRSWSPPRPSATSVCGPACRASARRLRAARPSCCRAALDLDEELSAMRAPDLTPGLLPDQHRDGRASSTAWRVELRGAARLRARCTTSTAGSGRSA